MRILFVILFISTVSFGQSKKELEDKVSQLNNSLTELQSQNKNLNTKIENIETQKKELDNNINDFRTKYENVLNDRVSQEKTISSLEKTMDSLITSTKTSTASKGSVVKLIEFSNANASFTVPEGKRWEIVNVFGDYASSYEKKQNDYDSKYYYDVIHLRIFIKKLNNTTLTDLDKRKIGSCVYRSGFSERAIRMPIILNEKSTISFLITKDVSDDVVEQTGKFYLEKADSKKAYINYIEYDN